MISHSPCLCSCLPWLCHVHCGEMVKFALWTLLLPALAAVLYPHWIGCVRLICDGEVGGFSALILSRSPERTLRNKTALIHNGARQNGRSGPFRLQAIISYVRRFIVEKNHAQVSRVRGTNPPEAELDGDGKANGRSRSCWRWAELACQDFTAS